MEVRKGVSISAILSLLLMVYRCFRRVDILIATTSLTTAYHKRVNCVKGNTRQRELNNVAYFLNNELGFYNLFKA